MSNQEDELEDLSKSRTIPIVNGIAISRDAIVAALASNNQAYSRKNTTNKPSQSTTNQQAHKQPSLFETSTNAVVSSTTASYGESYDGKIIDEKYKILALLGQGGMGAVYLAHHIQLNKDVALKTFHERNLTDDNRQRFQREAQSIGRLQHKNIVQVFDFGITSNGTPYYTMEVLEGENVAERIDRKGQLEQTEALKIFRELCQGLSICHQRKIVHRDIKPSNIFLELKSSTNDAVQKVKLVDFGIAALVDESLDVQRLTAIGTVFGSPLYMSPEQSMGLKVDARSDIYSAGCALFEMLTGRPPFCASTAFATMLCHQQAPVPTLTSISATEAEKNENNPTTALYPDWLERLVASMLAKDPNERVQTVEEVLDIIEYNKHSTYSSPPKSGGRQSVIEPAAALKQSGPLNSISGRKMALSAAGIAAICVSGFAMIDYALHASEPKAGSIKRADIMTGNSQRPAT
ncbi:hypothetical protein BH11CYA1_BH11CYA1_03530 [soil metagenome]